MDSFDGLWRAVHELMEFPDFKQLKVTQPLYHLHGTYFPPQIFLTLQTCGRGRALFPQTLLSIVFEVFAVLFPSAKQRLMFT